jgi:hypothetical protein
VKRPILAALLTTAPLLRPYLRELGGSALDSSLSRPAPVHFADFAAALCNRHRLFVAAIMFRNPSALILRFFLAGFVASAADPDSPRSLAHLAFCAAPIRRRAEALILRRLCGAVSSVAAAFPLELPVSIARSPAIWESMRSFWALNPSIAAYTSSCFSFIGKSVFPPIPNIGTNSGHFVLAHPGRETLYLCR